MTTSFFGRSAVLLMILGLNLQPVFAAEPATNDSPDDSPDNSKEPIILNTANVPPFHYAQDGKVVGLVPPVLECVLTKMKQPYQVRVLPWIRAQKEVEEGTAQGFFTANKNAARDRYATASDPVSYKVWNWYVRKDIDLKPTDPDFKEKVPVGVLAGTDDGIALGKEGYRTVPLKNAKQIAQMLTAKRIGAVKMIDVTMKDAMREAGGNLSDLSVHFSGAYPTSTYFGNGFLKRNPDFLPQFDHLVGQCFNPREE